MTATILYAAIFAFVASTRPTGQAYGEGDLPPVESCYSGRTIEYFQLGFLCGRVVTTWISTGVHDDTCCVICYIDCQSDGTARVTQYLVKNGVTNTEPDYSTLSDNGYGSMVRTFDKDPNNPLNVFIVSYTEQIDGTMKLVFIQCSDNDSSQFRIAFISDYVPTFFDEVNIMKTFYGCLPFTIIPNTCDVRDYFPECGCDK